MSSDDYTVLPSPRRPLSSNGLDGETVLPTTVAAGIHSPGDLIDNRYTVIREIGRGGMGVVYEVEDAVTTRRYAIKRLLPDSLSNEQIVRAFVREGTAAEQFSTSSPHFVTTKTVGKDTCGFYVLMELVNLPTLRQVLRASGRLELNRVNQILTSLASGLADLHKANLIHRDLKPENIFVGESGHATTIRLMDFGLTREVTANSTIGMSGGGSLKYMAPEQFRDEPATMASDVYAFGVIAYEMLTGELPTYGESLTDYVPDSPDQLVKVITRCLAGKVERRIDNAITLSKEFVGIGGHGLDVSTPSPIVRVGTLILSGIPDGATISLNGAAVSGLVHKLPLMNESQPIELLIQCTGYEDYQRKVMLASGMVTEHDVVTTRLVTKPKHHLSDFPHLSHYVDTMRQIPAGTFQMGSTLGGEDEKPVHTVTLSKFGLGVTPVTVGIWREYCLANGLSMPMAPSWGWQDDHPIVNISWHDIMGGNGGSGLCAWVSNLAGFPMSLPTEAQWEYGARGTENDCEWPWGNVYDDAKLWCSAASQRSRTASVIRSSNIFTNGYGLTDMSGNVREWCADFYSGTYSIPTRKNEVTRTRKVPAPGPSGILGRILEIRNFDEVSERMDVVNPTGPIGGTQRCVRGGSWFGNNSAYSRCANRLWEIPSNKNCYTGFRLAKRMK